MRVTRDEFFYLVGNHLQNYDGAYLSKRRNASKTVKWYVTRSLKPQNTPAVDEWIRIAIRLAVKDGKAHVAATDRMYAKAKRLTEEARRESDVRVVNVPAFAITMRRTGGFGRKKK